MKLSGKEELLEWAVQAQRLWLFLDYDGTLAGFAPTPDEIVSNPEITSLLGQLSRLPDVRVAVISGRRLKHLGTLLPVAGIFLAGTYGIEVMLPTGKRVDRVEYQTIRPQVEAVKTEWQRLLASRVGFFLEDKGFSVALHARFAEENEAEQVIPQARQRAQAALSTDQIQILGGHKFIEVAPQLANKGKTVTYLLSHFEFPGARLLYFGDDDKDEVAFGVIQLNQGRAVKIMHSSQVSNPTTADLIFDSPEETRQWLISLVQTKKRTLP